MTDSLKTTGRGPERPPCTTIGVLVPAHFQQELQDRCSHLGVQLLPYDPLGVPGENASGATALFRWWISPEAGDRLIEEHPLRWIHTGSAGVDHILTPRFLSSDIILTNSAGVHAPSIAEWVVTAMLAFTKGLPAMLDQQERAQWEKVERDELVGKRVVFLGGGQIAREVAIRLRPFGMHLKAVTRSGAGDACFDESRGPADFLEGLHDVDWLIVAMPLTAETDGFVNARVLDALPAKARLINVSRGAIVDEAALITALETGRLAGAMLDVFDEEPLPAHHPFWKMKSVLVLPHTTWRSPLVRQRQLDLFIDNLGRFVKGELLRNVVDVTAGY